MTSNPTLPFEVSVRSDETFPPGQLGHNHTEKCEWFCSLRGDLKAFIASELQRQQTRDFDGPVGVSQWEHHGKKYGYWDYFAKQEAEKVKAERNAYWLTTMNEAIEVDIRATAEKVRREMRGSVYAMPSHMCDDSEDDRQDWEDLVEIHKKIENEDYARGWEAGFDDGRTIMKLAILSLLSVEQEEHSENPK